MFEGRKSIKPDITLTDMSKATILKNHKQFENVIEKNIRYAQDIIADLPYKEKMPPDEKKMLIEALLLRACALWENYIEKEIVLLIDLDPSNLLNEFDLPKNTDVNPKLIRAIIFSDHYRDFHDIDRSMSFFDRVIVDKNNAFKKITKPRKGKINFMKTLKIMLVLVLSFSLAVSSSSMVACRYSPLAWTSSSRATRRWFWPLFLAAFSMVRPASFAAGFAVSSKMTMSMP